MPCAPASHPPPFASPPARPPARLSSSRPASPTPTPAPAQSLFRSPVPPMVASRCARPSCRAQQHRAAPTAWGSRFHYLGRRHGDGAEAQQSGEEKGGLHCL